MWPTLRVVHKVKRAEVKRFGFFFLLHLGELPGDLLEALLLFLGVLAHLLGEPQVVHRLLVVLLLQRRERAGIMMYTVY